MGYDRNPRGDYGQRDDYRRQDQARWDRDDRYSSDRMGRDDDRDYRDQRYGERGQMHRGYDDGRGYGAGDRDYYGGSRNMGQGGSGWGGSGWSRDREDERGGYGRGGFGQGPGYGRSGHDRDDHGAGRYGSGDWSRSSSSREGYGDRHPNDRGYSQQRGYGAQPQGYRYEDRGFIDRSVDEVRSWFGDEEAERRRDQDARMDERYQNDRDSDYGSWRRGQIDALDRDYHEYRQENRSRFENEFSSWRSNRQTQRDSLGQVKEHMEVVGSDGSHVGTVDKVRGDRIVLTKNDADAGGHHHSIPSSWLGKVDDKVTLTKTADEAKKAWRDEENRSMLGGQSGWSGSSAGGSDGHSRSAAGSSASTTGEGGRTDLNKSFSGTY